MVLLKYSLLNNDSELPLLPGKMDSEILSVFKGTDHSCLISALLSEAAAIWVSSFQDPAITLS